ncbi:hypothetical protein A6A06_15130 [Streptomyces sp. CB02923]|uniref:hypothetical protein n=1 Tax=Streptomyces sp. CB02923 TaxID=1718985 RepID=UPI00093BF0C0|nr:hypothetical protein [Streptomyces sp. CB02923]OKI02374.1 hypothetical protein A6A06_15130 [Streptomyces sp. CB02923]
MTARQEDQERRAPRLTVYEQAVVDAFHAVAGAPDDMPTRARADAALRALDAALAGREPPEAERQR